MLIDIIEYNIIFITYYIYILCILIIKYIEIIIKELNANCYDEMEQTKVTVHKILSIILLVLIDITFKKLIFLKSSIRRGGGEKRTEALYFFTLIL
jgi:hypothetical protein